MYVLAQQPDGTHSFTHFIHSLSCLLVHKLDCYIFSEREAEEAKNIQRVEREVTPCLYQMFPLFCRAV